FFLLPGLDLPPLLVRDAPAGALEDPGVFRLAVGLRGDDAPVQPRHALDEIPAVGRKVAPGRLLEDSEEVGRGRMPERPLLEVGPLRAGETPGAEVVSELAQEEADLHVGIDSVGIAAGVAPRVASDRVEVREGSVS